MSKRVLWVMEECIEGKWLPHERVGLTRKDARREQTMFYATLSDELPGDDLPRMRIRCYVPREHGK